ncbi:glutaminase [Brucella ovis IntaBari-2006-46-332]|nr:glutaminase [Brucella ovis 80/125]ENR06647.1 glutaminase [Brucella ovis F8/05B]ENS93279.1 glutaminase [Brucella ovis 63/96]ENS97744.1 glutaminase [Brucella ovis 81/8]ENT76079.1 glutaminase [Brucella ovis IntaBari-2009-88-4]ENT78322.1 glutaminase [Brucella ovis IntaBari-2006-46-348]ENT81871.1 glutaminase [Brucella ovis IntaBari-2010-47-268]ENT86463.1 glutaminase [Brucella ovis IntaBari-2006-46-332]ENT86955.1 glutaminase [Brucella ovis IntaBari-2010-47-871]ENT93042.1 glutaminase [Brucella
MSSSSDAIKAALEKGRAAGLSATGGKNADYIPFLASVPSDLFGLAVVTADGQTFKTGDADFAFAIESISKVFTLALVMEEIGPDSVREKVGADPTGLPFNSVIALELQTASRFRRWSMQAQLQLQALFPAIRRMPAGTIFWNASAVLRAAGSSLATRSTSPNRRPIFTTAPLPGCFTVPVLATAIRWRPWIFIRANVQRL